MKTIYQLKNHKENILRIQKATLETAEYGLQITHGLIGSVEWWKNIVEGRLELKTIKSRINKVYMGSMGDWPEFQIEKIGNHKTNWTREIDFPEYDNLYQVGKEVQIDYVIQFHKEKAFGGPTETEIVTDIKIEE